MAIMNLLKLPAAGSRGKVGGKMSQGKTSTFTNNHYNYNKDFSKGASKGKVFA